MSELLDHGVLDYAGVSYVLYQDSGEISDLTSADIYSFNETEGEEWYFDKIISGACGGEIHACKALPDLGMGFDPLLPNGGSNIYYARCSNIAIKTFSTDEILSLNM